MGEDRGAGWEAGVIEGIRELPNTAENVGEKVVPSVGTEAQPLPTTEETIQPNNKAPRRIHIIWFFCFFCDDGTCNKKKGREAGIQGMGSGRFGPRGVLPYIGYIGMCHPKGYGYGAVLA